MTNASRYNASILNRVVSGMIAALIAFSFERFVLPAEHHKLMGVSLYVFVFLVCSVALIPIVGRTRDLLGKLFVR